MWEVEFAGGGILQKKVTPKSGFAWHPRAPPMNRVAQEATLLPVRTVRADYVGLHVTQRPRSVAPLIGDIVRADYVGLHVTQSIPGRRSRKPKDIETVPGTTTPPVSDERGRAHPWLRRTKRATDGVREETPVDAFYMDMHGHSGHVEWPEKLDRLLIRGSSAGFALRSGESVWVHYAIPTPATDVEGSLAAVRLDKIYLRYRTGSTDCWIAHVHAYGAESRIRSHDDVNLQSDQFVTVELSPDPERAGPGVNHGLGLSINLKAGVEQGMSHQIDIASVSVRLIEIA